MEQGGFDVRVVRAPLNTPEGEPFATALARAFGVDATVGERIAREFPVVVKRNVPQHVAEGLRELLVRLGAHVEIAPAGRARNVASVATVSPAETVAPVETTAPVQMAGPEEGIQLASLPPPRSLRAAARPLSPGSVAPVGSLPPRAPLAPPPAPSRFSVSPLAVGLGIVAAAGLVLMVWARWMRRVGDENLLGNTPRQETTCSGNYCLKGPALADAYKAKHVLVVAWREGCLGDDYRAFLEDLASSHGGDLQVLGAGLAVPSSSDPRALGHPPKPPPDPWPPRDCAPRFNVLPIESGYASDLISAPATYLCDSDGSLIAVWRGGMAPEQRERLRTWIEGRAWEGHGGP
jgi:hypothetical protein